MTLEILKVVVIDDALGAPAKGTVGPNDKDDWIEYVMATSGVEAKLRDSIFSGGGSDLDTMLSELTGQSARLDQLWTMHQNGTLPGAGLEILFRGAALHRGGKMEKAQTVVDKLSEMVGATNVHSFPDVQSAASALKGADVAFVDFYLSNSETEDAAIERITASSALLKEPKLLFFMSSRASLAVQESVRQKVGVRTAFFEVMRKGDITPEFVAAKLEAKRASYVSNLSLHELVTELVKATRDALTDFEAECEELEVHDLRLLDLARLDAEGESLPEYLTWLFSESVAAKTRRKALPVVMQKNIPADAIGFTGQIRQGRVLSDQFSGIVFGSAVAAGKPIRFGELLRSKKTPSLLLLVLTPACDLQRCEPTKPVLCVHGTGTTYVGSKAFAREKLYGKQDDGRLCHLYTVDGSSENPTSTMINWNRDQIVTYPVKELLADNFERLALMNELFAQEVKEEVLRVLGRVGTQIDPPPAMALHAKLRWKKDGKTFQEADAPKDVFVSALLSYSEQKEGEDRKKLPTVVLSDEFRLWMRSQVEGSLSPGEELPKKLQNCLNTALSNKQFQLPKSFSVKLQELSVRVQEQSEQATADNNAFLEITLLP